MSISNQPADGPRPDLAELRRQITTLIRKYGHERREQPFKLSSAGWSHDYIDGKKAIANGSHLRVVAQAIAELAAARGVMFEAVGGMTMGADSIAVAVALHLDVDWFSVRKESKRHGKQKRIEGCELAAGSRVLLVDDVVTSGRSILQALDVVEEAGANVVLATTLIDRGEMARAALRSRDVAYEPLLTYRDLGIEPVG